MVCGIDECAGIQGLPIRADQVCANLKDRFHLGGPVRQESEMPGPRVQPDRRDMWQPWLGCVARNPISLFVLLWPSRLEPLCPEFRCGGDGYLTAFARCQCLTPHHAQLPPAPTSNRTAGFPQYGFPTTFPASLSAAAVVDTPPWTPMGVPAPDLGWFFRIQRQLVWRAPFI